MFVSSNGAGMGHITRLLALANRSGEGVEPVFFSMSQAVPTVARNNHPWEYCPSQKALGIASNLWNPFFAERFSAALDRHHPTAVVFDGTAPYRGIVTAAHERDDIQFVWSRRGMWRAGTTTQYFPPAGTFDLIVEPGEAAAAVDTGPTSRLSDARQVAPITLLDEDELFSRSAARQALGIAEDEHAVLLTLGAGNINDTQSDLRIFAEAAHQEFPGATVYATVSPIAVSGISDGAGIRPLTVYPLGQYLRAFDVVVAAAGYNVFHEVLLARVPCVFVPNLSTTTDDQEARARFAQDTGRGACVVTPTPQRARAALRSAVTMAASAPPPWEADADGAVPNGAWQAMSAIEELLATRAVR